MATSTELALIDDGADSPYELLRMSAGEVQALVGEALAPGERLTARDLTRVGWPGAGATSWEIPDPTGEISTKEIVGVVLGVQATRAYWKDEYSGQSGEDAQPDCSSFDCIVGDGTPGGECAACPLNQFETATKGEGKACKEYRVVFILQRGDILPTVLRVPPSSLDSFKSYRVGLMRKRLNISGVETSLKLDKSESASGIAYAKLNITMVGRLEPDAVARVQSFQALVTPKMERIVREETTRASE